MFAKIQINLGTIARNPEITHYLRYATDTIHITHELTANPLMILLPLH